MLLKEQVNTWTTSYLTTIHEHRTDSSQNRLDIPSNLCKNNDIPDNNIKIKTYLTQDRLDISSNLGKIDAISNNNKKKKSNTK